VQALHDKCLRGIKCLSRLLSTLGAFSYAAYRHWTLVSSFVPIVCVQALHDECLRCAKYLSRLLEALGAFVLRCMHVELTKTYRGCCSSMHLS
jgi:hypothetical protein